MSIFICEICQKTFTTQTGLNGHKRIHGKSDGKITNIFCCCLLTKRVVKVSYLKKLQANLHFCKHCNSILDSNRLFCNQSCAASFHNQERKEQNKTTKGKTKTLICSKCKSEYIGSIHSTSKSTCENCKSKKEKIIIVKIPKIKNTKQKTLKVKILGEYSKLKLCSCQHCKEKFVSRKQLKYCEQCKSLYCESSKQGYKFTFNVFEYPDLFDLSHLQQVGFYAPGGKSGKWNINGLSRDHKVSVNEAIRNNYDPYYISHPLNCQLIPHTENNKKKTHSSISYEELKQIVDLYDQKL